MSCNNDCCDGSCDECFQNAANQLVDILHDLVKGAGINNPDSNFGHPDQPVSGPQPSSHKIK